MSIEPRAELPSDMKRVLSFWRYLVISNMDQDSLSQNMYDSIIKDRRIKVFLSSTFKDMSEERDYLVRNVFMELEAEALKRNVALNLLDLRWGITAEESKQGLVTEICLKEIEASRPFFIGIIGDRYGWIPKEDDFPANSSLFECFPWVKEDIKNGLSITEIEIQYGVLRNKLPLKAFFYIKETSEDDTLDDSEEAKKLRHLKEQILTQKEHPVKYYKTAKDLGELIKLDIQQQMNLVFPKQEGMNPIEESAYIQECILRTKINHYIPIDGAFDYINNFIISPQRLLVIRGGSGTGKSSLLANWINNYKDTHNIFYHFVDTASNCADHDFILLRLYYYLCEQFQIEATLDLKDLDKDIITAEVEKLLKTSNKDIIIILDGLNQLNNIRKAYQLEWLPRLNQHFKLICSTNDDNYNIIMALEHKSGLMYNIPLFSDFHSFEKIVNGYLRQFGKKLEEKQIQQIFKNEIFKNALVLFSLLEELRLYGDYDTLNMKIDMFANFSSELDFIKLVFNRIDSDLSLFNDRGTGVGNILFLLTMARDGLSDDTIAKILNIPQIYVSSLLYKCHHFISVLGKINSISHSKIKNIITQIYKEKVGKDVFDAYENYLTNAIQDLTSKHSFVNNVLQLSFLYYKFDKIEKLNRLITTPAAFDVLYNYSLNEFTSVHKNLLTLSEVTF